MALTFNSKGFASFDKRNPCPVCGSGTKGCSVGNKADYPSGIYFCRGGSLSDEFTLLGESKDGVWELYARTEEVTESKRTYAQKNDAEKLAYRQELARKREAERQAKLARYAKLLSKPDRDRKLRNLLAQLSLSSSHTAELVKRGLTTEQIASHQFKTITAKQKVTGDVVGLPGFTNNTYYGASGIICPIISPEGLYLGFQIKNDRPDISYKEVNGARVKKVSKKYVWTYSGETSAHLKTGELPITAIAKGSQRIGLCEGILKPFVAASRHNQTFIGAAGGNFPDKQLYTALSKLNGLNQPVVIYPDAGCLANKDVYHANYKLAKKIQGWGYQVEFADWGQWLDKTVGDVDEITSLAEVNYLKLSDFEYYLQNQQAYAATHKLPILSRYLGIVPLIRGLAEKVGHKPKRKLELPYQESNWSNYTEGDLKLPGVCDRGIEFTGSPTALYQEASRKGYKYVLDISGTGTGKSYAASRVEPREAGKDKLFYLCSQPRNPTIAKLETEFAELPARNEGYDFDPHKATPTGQPVKIKTTKTTPDIPSNCLHTKKFQTSRANRSEIDICSKCYFARDCKSSVGKGYGFISQVRKALKTDKIRANPQGVSPGMVNERTLAIVDEYSQSVEWLQNITISKFELTQTSAALGLLCDTPGIEKLAPLMRSLFELIETQEGLYGRDTSQVLSLLPKLNLAEITEVLNSLEKLTDEYNSEVLNRRKLPEQKALDQLLQKNWLRSLVEVLAGERPYSALRQTKGLLTLTIRNDRLLGVFQGCGTVIFQDATGSRHDLALKLGCQPEDILLLRHVVTKPENITIHHIKGFGTAGKNRSPELQKRIKAAREAIASSHSSVGFIDFKAHTQPGDLYHFGDARGSNAFQKLEAVASFGIPIPALSALQSDYETFTASVTTINNPQFQAYVTDKVTAEILQEIGRLRANRRIDESLHYYLCGDCDTTFLEQLGYKVTPQNAIELAVDAGDRQSKARAVLLKAYKQLQAEGKKVSEITQTQLAQNLGKSQQTIAKLAKTFGGWQKLKEVIGCLLYRDRPSYEQDLGELTQDTKFLAQTYLPMGLDSLGEDYSMATLVTDLTAIEEGFGETTYRKILNQIPVEQATKFITKLVGHLPWSDRQEFLSLIQQLT